MISKYLPLTICGFMLFLFSCSAYAHARLKLDGLIPPRYTSDGIKTHPVNVPCGNVPTNSSLITGRISIFQVNTTIAVDWEETIEHPGYYVFEFSPAGDAGFDDPNNLIDRFDIDRNITVNNDSVNQRTHYLVNDTLGSSSTVIYSGTGTTFTDSSLSAGTSYYYKIFTYDTDYNYSEATTISAVTNETVVPDNGADSTDANSGGGSLFLLLLALIISLGKKLYILRVKIQ